MAAVDPEVATESIEDVNASHALDSPNASDGPVSEGGVM